MDPEVPLELPRGRHRLSRSVVAGSQRQRLLAAMADVVAEKGYARTTAAAVYSRAGVSSKAFYENFADKEACFLAAYDEGVEAFSRRVGDRALATQGNPRAAFGVLLEAYLTEMAAQRSFARTFLIEVYAAGPAALARRVEVHTRFVDLAERLLSAQRGVRGRRVAQDRRAAVEALVAAITFLVTMRVASDELAELPGLLPTLNELVPRLCPWVTEASS